MTFSGMTEIETFFTILFVLPLIVGLWVGVAVMGTLAYRTFWK